MARGNKFKPEGKAAVPPEQPPAAVSGWDREAGKVERPKAVAGKRKRTESGAAAAPSSQREAQAAGRAHTGDAARSSPQAPTNGQRSMGQAPGRKGRALDKADKAQQRATVPAEVEPAPAKASVPATIEGSIRGQTARPRSKKKRQSQAFAKLAKGTAPAAKAAASAVLEICHVSTVVAPPAKGQHPRAGGLPLPGTSRKCTSQFKTWLHDSTACWDLSSPSR